MALQVWLPLTKDLRNQGLSNVTVTNNGATFNSAGKLGGCYVFDGTDDAISIGNLSTLVETSFSFACWFYHSDTWSTKNYETILGGPSGFELEAKNGSTNSPVIKAYSWGGGSFTYELNKWNHLVMTRTSSETKFYLNGELKLTGTVGSIPSGDYFVGAWKTSTGQNYKGSICDVRVYDHCLSPMEVKQLSQGLVLHYPLADAYIEAGQNLCNVVRPGAAANSTWGGHVTQWTLYDATNDPVPFNDGIKGEIVYGQNGSTGGGASRSVATIAALPSTTYTYSCYVKPSDNFAYTHANFLYKYEYTAVSGGTRITEAGYFNSARKEHVGNGWYRIWGTFTTQSNTNALNISFYTYPNKSMTYWVGGWQIEQKDHVTPFMAPNTSRNNNVVYDTSGFCNNGTISGALTIASDTPKYKVSTHFSSAQIKRDSLEGEIKTLACWVKTTANKSTSQFVVADYNSNMCISFYSGCIIGCFGTTRGTGSKSTLGNSYKENDWNHIVVVKTGDAGERAIYCNGVLLTPTTNDYWSNAAGFLVSGRNTSNTLPMQGYISDVRAYATALSASDVKSLYQNCATIDPDGTIRGQIR